MKAVIYSLLILSAFSCKKKKSIQPEYFELISSAPWKLTAQQSSLSPSTIWSDDYSAIPTCNRDNLLYFKSDGSYEEKEGVTKCNSSDPDITGTGTWSLQNNSTELRIDIGGSVSRATILKLDRSILQLEAKQTLGGQTLTAQATFSH